jgi:hypothetical protein
MVEVVHTRWKNTATIMTLATLILYGQQLAFSLYFLLSSISTYLAPTDTIGTPKLRSGLELLATGASMMYATIDHTLIG